MKETTISPEALGELENQIEVENIQNTTQLNVNNSGYTGDEIKPKRKYVRKNPEQKIIRKRSPEHNQKISEAMKGRSLSVEHKQAISEAMIGNTNRN